MVLVTDIRNLAIANRLRSASHNSPSGRIWQ